MSKAENLSDLANSSESEYPTDPPPDTSTPQPPYVFGVSDQLNNDVPLSPSLVPEKAVERDRIVVLGRPQSGKTIFLATLYYQCWKQPGEFSIKALTGPTHKSCIEIVQELKDGNWPSSTSGTAYFDLEVGYRRHTRPLVTLDYGGEVFRKAFIDGVVGDDVQELLDHIDRAAGVIALVDPSIIESDRLTLAMEDDFGMFKAFERIRNWPSGDEIPIAFVLTKFDINKSIIKTAGTAAEFVRSRFPQAVKVARELRVFVSSAVQQVEDNGNIRVDPGFQPYGVVEPLKYILAKLEELEYQKEASEQRQRLLREKERLRTEQYLQKKRQIATWMGFWIGISVLIIILVFVTVYLTNIK